MTITPNYIEMRAADMAASKRFYSDALGFDFTDYGSDYAAVEGGPVQIGITKGDTPAVPLPTFETGDLKAAYASVIDAGGEIVAEPFDYPGGRRFEFHDPAGNRIAIYQPG